MHYEYVAFPVQALPSGTATVEIFRTRRSLPALCGATREETVAQTLLGVAILIYKGESGPRARLQVQRVQADKPLAEAVAKRDPEAARKAIDVLLHKHVVRLRVSTRGALLADVGGPYVLAPLRAPLSINGHQIGELELSIQDDEGYKRLAERLAGVHVVMSVAGKVVKNSLGALTTPIPPSGPYTLPRAQLHRLHDRRRSLPFGPPHDQGPGTEPLPVIADPASASCLHVAGRPLETSAAIEARALSKSYGSIEAVRGIDLDVASGETVALLGPNGAGKSTTIDMILGLSRPDGGGDGVRRAPRRRRSTADSWGRCSRPAA